MTDGVRPRLPALELVLQTGSYAYHVDNAELRRRRVPVALGRLRARVVGSAVPALTLFLMVACVRRAGEASRAMMAGEWPGLVGRDRLCAMKPGSVLVNTGRGAVVDEAALVDVLRTGPLAAAGLDVLADEPLPADHPLRALPNAVLTPHLGWTVEEVFAESAAIAADQVTDYLAGRPDPAELLDPEVSPAEGALGGLREASCR